MNFRILKCRKIKIKYNKNKILEFFVEIKDRLIYITYTKAMTNVIKDMVNNDDVEMTAPYFGFHLVPFEYLPSLVDMTEKDYPCTIYRYECYINEEEYKELIKAIVNYNGEVISSKVKQLA